MESEVSCKMGTVIVGLVLVIVVALVVRSMVRDRRTESLCNAAVNVNIADATVESKACKPLEV